MGFDYPKGMNVASQNRICFVFICLFWVYLIFFFFFPPLFACALAEWFAWIAYGAPAIATDSPLHIRDYVCEKLSGPRKKPAVHAPKSRASKRKQDQLSQVETAERRNQDS
jgi:hypothetical protein